MKTCSELLVAWVWLSVTVDCVWALDSEQSFLIVYGKSRDSRDLSSNHDLCSSFSESLEKEGSIIIYIFMLSH